MRTKREGASRSREPPRREPPPGRRYPYPYPDGTTPEMVARSILAKRPTPPKEGVRKDA